MSQALVSAPPRLPKSYWVRFALISIVLIGGVFLLATRGDLGALERYGAYVTGAFGRPHWPNLAPLIEAGPVVMTHVVTVLGALGIGVWLLLGVKGRLPHRVLGWAWVLLMVVTAFTTLFIHTINPGGLSFIHIFSAAVLIQAPLGLYFARRHNVGAHSRTMIGLFFGAVVIAGLFTFLPGRIMYQVFFG